MSLFGIKIQKDCKAPFNTSWDIKRWAMNARKMPEDWKMYIVSWYIRYRVWYLFKKFLKTQFIAWAYSR